MGRLVVFAAAMVGFGIGTAPAALAADDCGDGFHFDGGACVVNLPGPGGARFDPGHPNCRINELPDQRPGRPALPLTPAQTEPAPCGGGLRVCVWF